MTADIPVSQKSWRKSLFVGGSMGVLVFGVWGYMLVQHIIEESGPRKFPAVAYTSIWEYAVVALVFLVAPFIGACSGFRLVRSRQHPAVLVGWLMLVAFVLFFLISCMIYWSDYERYTNR